MEGGGKKGREGERNGERVDPQGFNEMTPLLRMRSNDNFPATRCSLEIIEFFDFDFLLSVVSTCCICEKCWLLFFSKTCSQLA